MDNNSNIKIMSITVYYTPEDFNIDKLKILFENAEAYEINTIEKIAIVNYRDKSEAEKIILEFEGKRFGENDFKIELTDNFRSLKIPPRSRSRSPVSDHDKCTENNANISLAYSPNVQNKISDEERVLNVLNACPDPTGFSSSYGCEESVIRMSGDSFIEHTDSLKTINKITKANQEIIKDEKCVGHAFTNLNVNSTEYSLPTINPAISESNFNIQLPSISDLQPQEKVSYPITKKPKRPAVLENLNIKSEVMKFKLPILDESKKIKPMEAKPNDKSKAKEQKNQENQRRQSQRLIERQQKREDYEDEDLEDEEIELEKFTAEDGSIFTVISRSSSKHRNVECGTCLKVIQQKTILTHITSKTHKEKILANNPSSV
ncbi:unnamed protein product [Blepharisma stoltei]|uniref:Uncharacterized protein n=1 Tax=Blepharisma stoltei TaxID=1481888 RepID=A0AAU9JXQ2_9CILI|nr:unnamed protein product [Blepharisma stoltei]